MKRIIQFLVVAAITGACLVSCKKDNPVEENYPSVDFNLKITEERDSHTFEWDVNGNNVSIDPAEQKLQELWVTSLNTVTVSALPKGSDFEGVNYSSSDAKRIKVIKVDDQTCTLEYIADTDEGQPITITAKAGEYSHSFKVFSKNVIPLEGVKWLFGPLGGQLEEYITEFNRTEDNVYPPRESEVTVRIPMTVTEQRETGRIDYLQIVDLVPENCSHRKVKWYSSNYIEIDEEHTTLNHGRDRQSGGDFSKIKGQYISSLATNSNYATQICIKTGKDTAKKTTFIFLYSNQTLD